MSNNIRLSLIISAIALCLVTVLSVASLTQSVNAFSWPCIDKTDGKAPMTLSGNNLYVAWWEKSGGIDIPMIRTSNDGGKVFSEAVVLTANSTS